MNFYYNATVPLPTKVRKIINMYLYIYVKCAKTIEVPVLITIHYYDGQNSYIWNDNNGNICDLWKSVF